MWIISYYFFYDKLLWLGSDQEAATLMEKAGVEERKVYNSTIRKCETGSRNRGTREEELPPPAPILLSRTDHCFTFAPAPYYLEEQVGFAFIYCLKTFAINCLCNLFLTCSLQVCWYQLCGRAAEGVNCRVRLGDYSLPGTGTMVFPSQKRDYEVSQMSVILQL